jgi:hypothetical protein
MEKASDLVWEFLNQSGKLTRGEVQELFSHMILWVCDEGEVENGANVTALALGLDALCAQSPDRLEIVKDYLTELREDLVE